jgi:hypothetical protein
MAMNDHEWVSKELSHYQNEERMTIERIKTAEVGVAKARAELVVANTELASAKEALAGARGGIAEFTWQMKHLEEHGRLP